MKINRLFTMVLLVASLVGCTGTGNTSSSSQTDGSTSSTNQVTENAVKIKSINAKETEVEIANFKARNRKNTNNTEDLNYIIITRPQTDITFTITLDNPEAYGIDALRVYCDDENAQIQVDGEYKPIAQESDGTRVINWASEDPYTKTYNIRTTSEDAINSFKVVDVRLAGHDKFQSKETNSTDLGNNELHIYKMDEDAYTLNVIENTFDYIKFNFNIKDEYKDIISNIKVDGLEMDEELRYWMLEESRNVSITYDYYLEEYGVNVNRSGKESIEILDIVVYDKLYKFAYQKYRAELDNMTFDLSNSLLDADFVYANALQPKYDDEINIIDDYYILNLYIKGSGVNVDIFYDNVKLEDLQIYAKEVSPYNDLIEYGAKYETAYISFKLENAEFKNKIPGDDSESQVGDSSIYIDKFSIFINSIEYKIAYTLANTNLVNNFEKDPRYVITGLEKVEE